VAECGGIDGKSSSSSSSTEALGLERVVADYTARRLVRVSRMQVRRQ